MTENASRQRGGSLSRLGASAREVIAAWFVLFLIVAAGLSLVAVHRYGAVDCAPMVAMPGAHHRFAAEQESDDAVCSTGPCGHLQSEQDVFSDSIHAAQGGDGDAPPIYSGSSAPVSGSEGSGDEDERLC